MASNSIIYDFDRFAINSFSDYVQVRKLYESLAFHPETDKYTIWYRLSYFMMCPYDIRRTLASPRFLIDHLIKILEDYQVKNPNDAELYLLTNNFEKYANSVGILSLKFTVIMTDPEIIKSLASYYNLELSTLTCSDLVSAYRRKSLNFANLPGFIRYASNENILTLTNNLLVEEYNGPDVRSLFFNLTAYGRFDVIKAIPEILERLTPNTRGILLADYAQYIALAAIIFQKFEIIDYMLENYPEYKVLSGRYDILCDLDDNLMTYLSRNVNHFPPKTLAIIAASSGHLELFNQFRDHTTKKDGWKLWVASIRGGNLNIVMQVENMPGVSATPYLDLIMMVNNDAFDVIRYFASAEMNEAQKKSLLDNANRDSSKMTLQILREVFGIKEN